MRWPLPDDHENDPLARAWEATRPAEPPASAWEPVWARVSHELDRADVGTVIPAPAPARSGRRYALAAFFAAQAAAIVLAVLWTGRQSSPEPFGPQAVPFAVVARGAVDIAPGRVVMIRADGAEVRVVEVASSDEFNGGVEDFYEMFNKVEAGFDTQLALND